ncbi:MAG: Holliday junction resolvase RuvX [Flavobacteriales bacterium]|nr:Holliday junction resolvase RuvX [Flavobacteriales bacterium]
MPRFIAFDFGRRRTGIAITDPDAIIASPHGTFAPDELWDEIARLTAAEATAGFVLGVPGLLSQTSADSSEDIAKFGRSLHGRYPDIPLHEVDEDYTSSEAATALVQSGMKKKKRQQKGALDRVAAALILQRFLTSR